MFTDRWYQTEAVDSIGPFYLNNLNNSGSKKHPLIGLPTGTGKNLVNTRLVQIILKCFPWHRGLCLTHSEKLISQNSKGLAREWPDAPMGICSAGLNRKDYAQPIIFGGIQTIVNKPEMFGHRDFVIIDEAHSVSDKETTSYFKFLNAIFATNPNVTVIGLSATLYRMKMGSLLDNGLFTDVAYDLTGLEGFNRLLSEGYISQLIPQPTETTLDVSGVKKSGGEYAQGALQEAVDKEYITQACCEEMVSKAWDRHCCMVFASGIEHAEHIAQCLTSLGQTAAAVHSKKKESDQLIEEFKAGRIKWIINFGQLTTGFDHPPIDLIGMLRPSMSPGLWVQMLGRGTRPYDGRLMNQYIKGFEYIKQNCLVLDFAGNTERLGPINDPVLPRAPGKGGGDAPIKLCPNYLPSGSKCGTYNHASARFCCLCGFGFEIGGAGLMAQAGTAELIRGGKKPPEVAVIDVSYVLYSLIEKNGSPPMMRVSYFCGLRKFDEIVCLEHKTYAKVKAAEWWQQRYNAIPETTQAGLNIAKSGALPTPKRIRVWLNKLPYPEVMNHEY